MGPKVQPQPDVYEDDGLGPLDGGAEEEKLYGDYDEDLETSTEPEQTPAEPEQTPAEPEETPVEPEETPTEPEQTPVEPEQTPAEPEETGEHDDDLYNMFLEKVNTPAIPDGLPQDEAELLSRYRQQKAQAGQGQPEQTPAAQEEPHPVFDVEPITDDEWQNVFENRDTFQNVVKKALNKAHKDLFNEMDKALVNVANYMVGQLEEIVSISDVVTENTEVEQFWPIYHRAFAKARDAATDPTNKRAIAKDALARFTREYNRAKPILAQTEKNKIDVRGKQTPPKPTKQTGRQAFDKVLSKDDSGLSFLHQVFKP